MLMYNLPNNDLFHEGIEQQYRRVADTIYGMNEWVMLTDAGRLTSYYHPLLFSLVLLVSFSVFEARIHHPLSLCEAGVRRNSTTMAIGHEVSFLSSQPIV